MDCYIDFKKLQPGAIIPVRATDDSAGFDLFALEETVITGGDGNILVPTGISVTLPRSSYGRIAMRSGLAKNQHLCVSAGVIDYDYTGPIGVLVFTSKLYQTATYDSHAVALKPFTYTIRKGERFAQLVVECIRISLGREIVDNNQLMFNAKHMGFGSTGKGVITGKYVGTNGTNGKGTNGSNSKGKSADNSADNSTDISTDTSADTGEYSGKHSGKYSGEYSGKYSGEYSGKYSGDYVNDCIIAYAGDYTNNTSG